MSTWIEDLLEGVEKAAEALDADPKLVNAIHRARTTIAPGTRSLLRDVSDALHHVNVIRGKNTKKELVDVEVDDPE